MESIVRVGILLDEYRKNAGKAMIWRLKLQICLNLSLFVSLLITTYPQAAGAVEQLHLRLGFLGQSVAIADLESFASTGEVPPSLQLYRPLLTPEVQKALGKPWQIPPSLAERFLDDLLPTTDGERVIASLHRVIPEANLTDLRLALITGAKQEHGLTLINLLRQYPGEKLTVDIGGVLAIALQVQTSYLQSKLLSPWIAQEFPPNAQKITSPVNELDPSQAGAWEVRRRSWSFSDPQRQRTIPVDIYWGRGKNPPSPAPLVVISHGFAADRHFLDYLANHLASHGLVVITIEHPKSNINWLASIALGNNPDALLPAREFIDRPLDVSFILDQLAEINQRRGFWQGNLATDRVAIIGHSLGGYTALALAGGEINLAAVRQFCQTRSLWERSPADWFQCGMEQLPAQNLQLADARIAQAIVLNPVTGKLFGQQGLSKITIPTLILTSTNDAVTPSLDHQLKAFQQLNSPKYLLSVIGGTHLSASDPRHINQDLATNPLVPEVIGEAAAPLHEVLKGVTLSFVQQLTPEAANYSPFLTSTYIQSRSTDSLSFRFNTSLSLATTTFMGMF